MYTFTRLFTLAKWLLQDAARVKFKAYFKFLAYFGLFKFQILIKAWPTWSPAWRWAWTEDFRVWAQIKSWLSSRCCGFCRSLAARTPELRTHLRDDDAQVSVVLRYFHTRGTRHELGWRKCFLALQNLPLHISQRGIKSWRNEGVRNSDISYIFKWQ